MHNFSEGCIATNLHKLCLSSGKIPHNPIVRNLLTRSILKNRELKLKEIHSRELGQHCRMRYRQTHSYIEKENSNIIG